MLQFNDVLFFLILMVTWVVFRISRAIISRKISVSRELIVNLLFFYLCYVISVTFFPFTYLFYSYGRTANLIPLVKSLSMIQNAITLGAMVKQVVINLAGNLLLLAPLGFILPVLLEKSRTALKVIGISFAVSLSIELSQLSFAVRIFDVDDILLNTLGALLGYAVFKLIFKIPAVARLVNGISRSGRKGFNKALLSYGLVALLTFLSIFTAQVFAETKTIDAVSQELTATNRQLIGMTSFDGFVSLFSQAREGRKSVDIYLKVFLNRYTLFLTQDDLQNLQEDTYAISTASKGSKVDYFIIARSSQDISQMVYQNQRYPVTTFGEYHFAYTTELLTNRDHFDPFDFVDTHGTILNLSPVN
jgi:glycopeptide antibiotics resistance protein